MRSQDTRGRDAWLHRPVGARLLRDENRCLGEVLPGLTGHVLVQAGGWGRHTSADAGDRVLRRIVAERGAGDADLAADADALPFAADSVDVMVLPHTLEFTDHPHQVLREAYRVLVAGGRLLVLGFNPWSGWGLWRLVRRGHGVPWSGRFIGEHRLRDWLAVLGFAVEAAHHCAYAPPLELGRMTEWLDAAGARGWPLPAGAYLLLARKQVIPVTPVRPRWKAADGIAAGMPQPTARVMHD